MTSRVTTLPDLPPRPANSHKGSFGRVLVVAGSRGMSGAAVLAGSAALRGGAGLVEVASPAEVQPIIASGNPCYLTTGLPQDALGCLSPEAVSAVVERASLADVVALGPGLGLNDGVREVVRFAVSEIAKPVVLDADGLNALALLTPRPVRPPNAPLILTPHPGEFSRLTGKPVAEVQSDRERLAAAFPPAPHVVLVLKGQGTIVTDGEKMYVNETGNPGMATGGTGDVLTGLIAALLAQGFPPFPAAQLGVYLHGLAGDIARDHKGEYALIATDVLDHLPSAFLHYARKCQPSFGFRVQPGR